MKRKIFSLFTSAVLVFSTGMFAVTAEEPIPEIAQIVVDSTLIPDEDVYELPIEIQGTNLSEQVAVFLCKNGDPEPTSSANYLNLGNINDEKTSGSVTIIGESPDVETEFTVYTSIDDAQTWAASSAQVTILPVPASISSISPANGKMVHSGESMIVEVTGVNLNSAVQFKGNWDGSEIVTPDDINPEKTTAVFTLDLPENETDKAIVYCIQCKIGENEWQDASEILVRTAASDTDLQVSNTSFPSGGGTVNVSANADGMGRIEGIRFSLIERNGYDVVTPTEVPADENNEEIYAASASLTIPENTSTAAKTYFLAMTFQLNWWDGEAEWAGIDQKVQITVAGKSSSNENSSDSSHTSPSSPEKVKETYTADVISKANSSQTAVNIQNILAYGDKAEKAAPVQLAELNADDKNVQVNIVPQDLPSNVSSEQIQTVLDAVSSVNFSKTPAEAKDTIDKATQEAGADVLYVNFALPKHVEFGFDVQITVPTSFAKGTGCYLYYWNDSTKIYEQVDDFMIDENGNATFSISHCSDYFIANKQLSNGLSAGEGISETVLDITDNPRTGNAVPYAVVVLAFLTIFCIVKVKKVRR